MGTFLIILILLFLIWPLVRNPLSRWFQGFMSRRAEDMMRKAMGMPSRKEERRRRQQQRARQEGSRRNRRDTGQTPPQPHPAAVMKSVAVDVEFTEIKEFDSESGSVTETQHEKIRIEEQISDAEYTEVKTPSDK